MKQIANINELYKNIKRWNSYLLSLDNEVPTIADMYDHLQINSPLVSKLKNYVLTGDNKISINKLLKKDSNKILDIINDLNKELELIYWKRAINGGKNINSNLVIRYAERYFNLDEKKHEKPVININFNNSDTLPTIESKINE